MPPLTRRGSFGLFVAEERRAQPRGFALPRHGLELYCGVECRICRDGAQRQGPLFMARRPPQVGEAFGEGNMPMWWFGVGWDGANTSTGLLQA